MEVKDRVITYELEDAIRDALDEIAHWTRPYCRIDENGNEVTIVDDYRKRFRDLGVDC